MKTKTPLLLTHQERMKNADRFIQNKSIIHVNGDVRS